MQRGELGKCGGGWICVERESRTGKGEPCAEGRAAEGRLCKVRAVEGGEGCAEARAMGEAGGAEVKHGGWQR